MGKSANRIYQYLSQKGVKKDDIAQALAPQDEDQDAGDQEIIAARAFAKRRGLGPYRKAKRMDEAEGRDSQAEAKQKAKDIAALARAGFSFDVAKQVLGAMPEDFDLIDPN